MRKINKILIGLILIATMFLGIGYSAIQNITLDITGTITAERSGPYIPTGFSQVQGTSLETGFTIQDSLRNQYVWIEVPKDENVYSAETLVLDLESLTGTELTDAYDAIESDLHTYTSTYRNNTAYTDTYYSGVGLTETEYYKLKNKMLKSVFENGGFYVGKYETGIADSQLDEIDTTVEGRSESGDTTQTPVIQANAYPYNWVTCAQAQTLASSMLSGEYTSSLLFGVQWDLVLKYLETKATNQTTIVSELNSDSTSWGNYYNNTTYNITNTSAKYYVSSWVDGAYGQKDYSRSVLLSTGASNDFVKQGIYDFAGNVYEWTLEYSFDSYYPRVYRGGVFYYDGNRRQAYYRGSITSTEAYSYYGFRVSLY